MFFYMTPLDLVLYAVAALIGLYVVGAILSFVFSLVIAYKIKKSL